jgi:hypothetical protein
MEKLLELKAQIEACIAGHQKAKADLEKQLADIPALVRDETCFLMQLADTLNRINALLG